MEIADGEDGKPPPEEWKKPIEGGEKPPKRKMKSPYQLEILEKTYAVETYPSETLRVELSAKTGLSDRQLQMWFCHRRLKDRKYAPVKRARKEEEPLPPPSSGSEMMEVPTSSSAGTSSIPFAAGGGVEPRKAVARVSPAVSRIGAEFSLGKRYYEQPILPPQPPPLSVLELRIIASVEAQLGEALREGGPILGVEFDPLPPGAFGAPIDSDMPAHSTHVHSASLQFLDRLDSSGLSTQTKQLVRPYDGKSVKSSALLPSMDHHFLPSSLGGKRKATVSGAHAVHPQVAPRALQEYQFLPEQPSIRSESYERVPQSQFYDSPVAVSSSRMPSISTGSQYMHGNEHVAPTYTFQGQISSSSLLTQHARDQLYTNDYDSAPHGSPLGSTADPQFGVHQAMGLENPFLSSDRRIVRDEDSYRTERKRKSEEARIAKEVEAHEKRIRKELEKQDILRRKREEQMRREMERLDRERRKEEDRMLREKQREEERFIREQRRENERQEKILLKESRRAEKLRRKEDTRREKEAARLKAANERATARRIAKESMELLEDERLELMELAASMKGLPSIVSLDSDTLEHLDSFRDLLNAFPPKSVKLKRPFSVQPWIESEENVGNFLMVWKFLITFADVLGLWPFTLDEFLQSLHDYDSRLLGEIHVVLLKSIIKDIEDVARTPAIALGVNQNSAANPGGGHPHIVEGAYAWGFNIRTWQRHLNYLTWPEILRQFALSAGFGPQLNKRNFERTYFRDENEGNDGEEVISTLRNGAAAENAVALMQVRGYNLRRRPRHRLTPGTVKFAAFYVLSLEGSRGLTILEVAEKIQKSGLRDLTTSKTPEASIAAALSRDTKLFERTAPSTYCVRPAFRKDPTDADAILAAAREKIQVFQSGLSDSEEVEKDAEDADDVERDEDSEFEGADDPEVDDCSTEGKLNKDVPYSNKLKGVITSNSVNKEKGEILCDGDGVGLTSQSSLRNAGTDFQVQALKHSNEASISAVAPSADAIQNCNGEMNTNIVDAEIDESNFGEPWVQGLTEGDYTDLSVEERLNALVALIGVAIEGNSIRVILEERLEAATALKKQMWAEAQLDKRRYKEEYLNKSQHSAFMVCKTESAQAIVGTDGSQTPLQLPDTKDIDGNTEFITNDQFPDAHSPNNIHSMPTERNVLGQDLSTNPDLFPVQQYGHATEKSRFQLKSYIGHKAEQLYVYRSLPLGQDRRRNRYWLFSTSASPNDPGSGRIFFESRDGFWMLIDSEETFDALLAALDTRGIRESHLHSMLQRIETTFKEAAIRNKKRVTSANTNEFSSKGEAAELTSSPDCNIDSPSSTLCGVTSDTLNYSTSFRVDLGRCKMERTAALKRYQGFLKWMWKECCNPLILCTMKYGKRRCSELLQTCNICYQSYFAEEKHCTSCHSTFKSNHKDDAMFSEHIAVCIAKRKIDKDFESQMPDSLLPIGVRLLKAQLSLIEASISAEALQPFWTEGYRKSWGVKLNLASSADDFLQLLTLLEGAIKRDYLSPNFETTNELLSSATSSASSNNSLISGSVLALPWIPDAIAAVALRLLELDASISYLPHQRLESQKERDSEDFIKLPSRFTIVKNIHEFEPVGNPEQVDYLREGRWLDPGSGRRGRGRGSRGGRVGRGRGRVGRGARGGLVSRAEFKVENISNFEKTTRKYNRRGRTRGRGRRRGRRSVRPRQRSESQATAPRATFFGCFGDVGIGSKEESAEEYPKSSGGDEWGIEARTYIKDDNSAGSQSYDNGQASGDDEYDDQVPGYARHYSQPKPMGNIYHQSEDDDGDAEDEDDDGDQVALENVEADVDEDEEEMGEDDEEMCEDDEIDDGEEDNGDEDEIGDGEEGNGDEDEGASYFSSEYSD